MKPQSRFLLVSLLGFGALLSVLSAPHGVLAARNQREAKQASPAPGDEYVGDSTCKSCHAGIYKTYAATRMGQSMSLVTPKAIQKLVLPASVYSAKLDRHYDTFSKDGHLFQSEWQTAADGKEIFRNTQEMTWLMGAGANGFGAVLKRGDFLFESPLSFYTRAQAWELSPGYTAADIAFNRPIQADCISCHSGRPMPADATSGRFKPVAFEQLSIGCENCHGPGGQHVKAMHAAAGTAAGNSDAQSAQIANPADWDWALQNDLCMSCHEGGDARVFRPGKTYADFRPGEPLDKTLLIYMKRANAENVNDTEHVQHYLQMTASKCYRQSGARMSCLTCHDPHMEPIAAEAPAYFNAKCVTCHTSSTHTCTLDQAAREATRPADNCISCHMPRREAVESAHTTLANHRILARPGEPWPADFFKPDDTAPADLVLLNRHDAKQEPASSLSLLEAYASLMQKDPEYVNDYNKSLTTAEHQSPDHAEVQSALALRDLSAGATDAAALYAERSIALDAQRARAYAYLSEARKRQGRIPEAIAAIQKAVALEPYNASLQRALIGRFLTAKQYHEADDAAQKYIQTFPEDAAMRSLLLQIRSAE